MNLSPRSAFWAPERVRSSCARWRRIAIATSADSITPPPLTAPPESIKFHGGIAYRWTENFPLEASFHLQPARRRNPRGGPTISPDEKATATADVLRFDRTAQRTPPSWWPEGPAGRRHAN
ncbi:Golgi-body localisation protein domain [Striga asiatica]|uniref:Golgi-body localisation protein domain n=1 Tax=Striga asiatica TaxID=4170 RepID=A0A5A7PQW7_STRAF|nr:Golgi-body localisation protein domain [Striga asiatica]